MNFYVKVVKREFIPAVLGFGSFHSVFIFSSFIFYEILHSPFFVFFYLVIASSVPLPFTVSN